MKTAGPYRRYSVTFVANPRDLECVPAPGGTHHCEMEALSYVYDADGTLANSQVNRIDVSLSAERYTAFLKSPFAYRQQVSVPVHGEYYLRPGLRDDTADRVGALELPVASVVRLPPTTTPGTAPGLGVQPK